MAATDFTIEFEFQDKRFRNASRGLRALAERLDLGFRRVPRILRTELQDFLESVQLAMEKRHSTPWAPGSRLPEGPQRGRLHRRSGRLLKSFRVQVRGGRLESLHGTISVTHPGAGVHEYGATIRPKRAQYLAIPLPAALDARGVPKKKGPRAWRNTFVAQSRKGNLLIFQRRRGGIVPLYALKRQVTISPRLGLRATLARGVPVFQDRLFDRVLDALLREVA